MIKRFAITLALFLISLPAIALAAEGGEGVIKGALVNGTEDGASVADQTVTLVTYLNDAETGVSPAKSDAEGRFAFTGLKIADGYSYELKIRYQEADYTGERITLSANETAKSVVLKVYDSTNNDAAVKISVAHTIVTPADGGLEVMEFLVFSNSSDHAYIGFGDVTSTGTRKTVRLPMPAAATDVQIGGDLMSCCVLNDPAGFFDTMAVLPGDKTLIYSYKVKSSSASYAFVRKVDYPMTVYQVLVQGEGTGLSAEGLTSDGPVTLNGVVYNSLSGGNLARGVTLDIRLTGLPRGSSQQAVIWAAITMVALGAAGAFFYMMRKKNLQVAAIESSPEDLRERLLLDIAALDDDFEAGLIEKEAYSNSRAEKKSQLIGLMQNDGGEMRKG